MPFRFGHRSASEMFESLLPYPPTEFAQVPGILFVQLGEGEVALAAAPPPDGIIAIKVAARKTDVTKLAVIESGELSACAAIRQRPNAIRAAAVAAVAIM
jgi:hypothetical protein